MCSVPGTPSCSRALPWPFQPLLSHPFPLSPLDPAARQIVSCQQALCLRDLWALLSGQANVLVGWGWGGPDQMLQTLNLTLVCHTPLFSPIFSPSKKEQSVHWSPRPPMPFVGLGHTPGPGCCMHSRPVLYPPSPCLCFTGPGLLLSREATHVIKNNCYAK